MNEVEVKIVVGDAAAVRRRLEELGAGVVRPREFEDNRLYDHADRPGARAGRILRVRRAGERSVITAKAPADSGGRFKVRREAEMEIADADRMAEILETAGLSVVWRYQKYRTTWKLEDALVTLDEIPHGTFLEIEGEGPAIEEVARRLGYGPDDYSTDTYRDVHEAWCRSRGVPVGDMVFPEGAS